MEGEVVILKEVKITIGNANKNDKFKIIKTNSNSKDYVLEEEISILTNLTIKNIHAFIKIDYYSCKDLI